MTQSGGIDMQESLARLNREQGQGVKDEYALVAASGAMLPAWMIEVVSNAEYNLYNVRQVRILSPGVEPVTLSGSETEAFNLAESFLSTGSVAAGTYAVMWRAGDQNVFYVIP